MTQEWRAILKCEQRPQRWSKKIAGAWVLMTSQSRTVIPTLMETEINSPLHPTLSSSYFGSLCFIQPLQTDDFLSFTSHPGVPPFWDPCPPHFSGPITHSSSSSAPCSLCSFRCCRQMRMPVAATAVAMMAAMMPPMMPPVAPAPAVLGVSARRGTV